MFTPSKTRHQHESSYLSISDPCCRHCLLSNGMAARWKIPKHLQQRAHINFLEFLGQLAAIWMLAIENCIIPNSCLLVNGDSSTAQGWIRKSNFPSADESDPEINVKLQAARKAASILMEKEACVYSQWVPGDENDITDSLSRDLHSSDHQRFPQRGNHRSNTRQVRSWLETLESFPQQHWYPQQPLPPRFPTTTKDKVARILQLCNQSSTV